MLQTEKLLKKRIINDLTVAGNLAFSERFVSDADKRKRAISNSYFTRKVYCNAQALNPAKQDDGKDYMDYVQGLFHTTEYSFCKITIAEPMCESQ